MSQKFLNPVEVNGQVSAEYLDLSTTTTHTAGVGELVWNDTDGTMDIGLKGGNVKLQVGQEQLARVVNKTSPLINLLESDYQVVVITGATGQRLSVKLAQGNNDANSAGTLGVVTETINANQEGFITISGQVREINTTGSLQGETWSDGDLLFLSATTPGAITNIRPIAPNHTVNIGYVEYAHAIHGKIYVKVDNGYELGELHDVDTSESKTTPIDADNLLLQDSADLSVWKKLSWSNTKATLKTYFDTLYQSVLTNPITGTGTTNYLSKFTGITSLGNSQIFDNGTNVGIGTTSPSEKFEVQNSASGAKIKVSNTGGGYATLECSSNATSVAQLSFTNQLSLIGGNVGIGATNTFGWKTFINSGSSSSTLLLGSSTSGVYVSLNDNNSTTPPRIGGITNDLVFTTSNAERMRITSGGNVGIGTTSPGAKLEVAGASRFTGAGGRSVVIEGNGAGRIDINGDGSAYATGILFNSQLGGTALSGIWNYGSGTSQQWLALGGTAYNNSSMYILPSGNVGIGTTSSSYRTQIETTGADVFLTKNTSSTSFNRSYFYNNNNVGIQFLNFGSAYGFGTEFGVGQNGSVIQSNTTSAFAVGTSGAYPLLLGTSGSERMRIDSSGNILVGQTSPIYSATNRANLTIGKSAGSILVLGTSTAANGYLFYNNTDLELANSTSSGSVFFRTSGTERMRITSSGTVGIGTSSPSGKFEIDASGSFNWGFPSTAVAKIGTKGTGGSLLISTPSLNSSYESGFAVDGTYTSGKSVINLSSFGVYSGGPYSSDIAFRTTSQTTMSEAMRITSEGNVGIGTSSPNFVTTNRTVLSLNGSTNSLMEFQAGGAFKSYFHQSGSYFEIYETSALMLSVNGGERMRINSSGNVGIGTSSPSTKLQVNGDISSVMTGPAGNTGMYRFGDGSTFMLGGTTSPFVSFELGYSEKMRIEGSTDNVGIGTSTPNSSAKLDVSSTTQGFLPPRMNDTEMNNISSPVDGLMVFNTDVNTICVYISSAGGWKRLTYA